MFRRSQKQKATPGLDLIRNNNNLSYQKELKEK